MPPRRFEPEALRQIFIAAKGASLSARMRAAAATAQCSIGTMGRAINERDAGASHRSAKPTSNGRFLGFHHPAVTEGRTLFPTTVYDPDESVLKPGGNSAKLGDVIQKGRFKGYAIYSLSLEERATCPASCKHWGSCFGNNMHLAKRYRHGPELERRLPLEVAGLLLEHPAGVAVRLHNLGDFYSWQYVDLWRDLVARHDRLMVFGFTAHIDPERDLISRWVVGAVRDFWPRFAIRFSNGEADKITTASIEHPGAAPPGSVICPSQWTPSGKTAASCGTCAFCWQSTRRVAFLRH